MSKTDTIKQRRVDVYLDSLERKKELKKIAEEEDVSLSKFIQRCVEYAGERVDLCIPVFHLAWDEFRLKYASVRYHGLSTRHATVLNGSVSFPNLPIQYEVMNHWSPDVVE